MKNSLIIFILIFCVQFLHAQTGYKKFYHPNGTISAEGMMQDGKPVGMWKSYYPDGTLKSEGIRKNNNPDSIWNFYNRQGILTGKISYRDGERNGYSEEYDFSADTGQVYYLKAKELYLNGKKNGESEYYRPNGVLDRTLEYEDGYKHGKEIFYNDTGLIITIVRYVYDNITDSENINRVDRHGQKQGVWKSFYPSGQLKESASYLDGQLHGYKRLYNEKGKLVQTDYYIRGTKQTKEAQQKAETENEPEYIREYYNSGNIKSEGAFINEKPVGVHTYYAPDGKIEYALDFDTTGTKTGKGLYSQDGKRVGKWQHFYSGGSLKSEGLYQNGLRHGKWTFYFPNSKTEQTGNYLNGKPQGAWKWFYESGAVRRTGQFRNGKEYGEFVEYSQTYDTLAVGSYSEGFKQGLWKRYVNDMTYMENYSYGSLDGDVKHYFSDGTLAFEGTYTGGLPDGEHIYYHPNGKIKLKAFYFSGKRTKKWYKYAPDGQLVSVAEYKNDEKIKIDGVNLNTDF